MMMDYDLMDCPFCGCSAEVKSRYSSNTDRWFFFVICRRCRAQTGAFNGSGAAVDAWNTRIKKAAKIGDRDCGQDAGREEGAVG